MDSPGAHAPIPTTAIVTDDARARPSATGGWRRSASALAASSSNERRVEHPRGAVSEPRGPANDVDRAAVEVGQDDRPGQLDDLDRRQRLQCADNGVDGARPRQADDVTSSHHLLEHVGRQVEVQRALAHDLDADQAHLARRVEHPRHLEPADPELLGDLDLRPVVQVVAPRHSRSEHQLRGSELVPPGAPFQPSAHGERVRFCAPALTTCDVRHFADSSTQMCKRALR